MKVFLDTEMIITHLQSNMGQILNLLIREIVFVFFAILTVQAAVP